MPLFLNNYYSTLQNIQGCSSNPNSNYVLEYLAMEAERARMEDSGWEEC